MHIGFILDGNRRWAQKRGLLKMMGHNYGLENLEKIAELCAKEEIEYVSAWVIAKKNLEERSPEEIKHLFELIQDNVERLLQRLMDNGYKFEVLGDMNLLPEKIVRVLWEAQQKSLTSWATRTFVLVIGYGGQDEIVRGVKSWAKENEQAIKDGRLEEVLEQLNEKTFLPHLDSGRFPSPDLIIRTGGDIRHSGYFLYTSEYSEYHFTPVFWPDFSEDDFYTALGTLKKAKRNFGK